MRCGDVLADRHGLLNERNPYLWLKAVLAQLPSYPINWVAELLPLANYKWA
jgi:hypothetical protein